MTARPSNERLSETVRDAVNDLADLAVGWVGSPATASLQHETRITRCVEAVQVSLDELLARLNAAETALRRIHETAGWYARNGQRLEHEVDHALCVEVLSYAQDGLSAGEGATQ